MVLRVRDPAISAAAPPERMIRPGAQPREAMDAATREIAPVQAWTAPVVIASGVFVDDDPILLARTTNAMHQVALSRWVDDGMVEAPEPVVHRMQHRFVRAFCVPERVLELLAAHGLRGRS